MVPWTSATMIDLRGISALTYAGHIIITVELTATTTPTAHPDRFHDLTPVGNLRLAPLPPPEMVALVRHFPAAGRPHRAAARARRRPCRHPFPVRAQPGRAPRMEAPSVYPTVEGGMTADLMEQIQRRQAYLVQCADALSKARRAVVLAEVTHGMNSPDFRHASLDVRKLNQVIGQCTYDLQFARERLARLCEPWFQVEVNR